MLQKAFAVPRVHRHSAIDVRDWRATTVDQTVEARGGVGVAGLVQTVKSVGTQGERSGISYKATGECNMNMGSRINRQRTWSGKSLLGKAAAGGQPSQAAAG